MEVQQQRIQEITANLTGLKIDIDLKNDRINKQTGLMEFQQQQIEAISTNLDIRNDRVIEPAEASRRDFKRFGSNK